MAPFLSIDFGMAASELWKALGCIEVLMTLPFFCNFGFEKRQSHQGVGYLVSLGQGPLSCSLKSTKDIETTLSFFYKRITCGVHPPCIESA